MKNLNCSPCKRSKALLFIFSYSILFSVSSISQEITSKSGPLVIVDGAVSEKTLAETRKELGYNLGFVLILTEAEAKKKYGETGVNGVIEVISRKSALAMGLKPSFPRLSPDDFPTFMNKDHSSFDMWVINQVKYPEAAKEKKEEGIIRVEFTVGPDGNVKTSNTPVVLPNPLLHEEVKRIIKSSPKWESPKNTDIDEPFTSTITVRFKLPDEITPEESFPAPDQMPVYPGGNRALLRFISSSLKYPEEARIKNIQGVVFVRFLINIDGNIENLSILKSAHPLLDAEALRVTGKLSCFMPGMKDGVPVSVWYMIPITFKN